MERTLIGRREAIALLEAAGAALAAGCGSPTSPSSTGSTGGPIGGAACGVTPSETAGPFPSLANLIRSDIREGRSGTPLTLTISVVNASANCGPVVNVQVEIWQCDAAGNYSEYGSESGQTYLRGIQTTDAAGQVMFTTVYPGCIRAARPTSMSKSRAADRQ
jgi:protocatechuate 3,4-dioxygenase beta subunit